MQNNLAQIKDIFSSMIKDGFDVKKELKWSYYFIDDNKKNLENLFFELKKMGYSVEDFYYDEDESWILQVNKIEILTPEDLYSKNVKFNEIADSCSVRLYDGWDVGKIQ